MEGGQSLERQQSWLGTSSTICQGNSDNFTVSRTELLSWVHVLQRSNERPGALNKPSGKRESQKASCWLTDRLVSPALEEQSWLKSRP